MTVARWALVSAIGAGAVTACMLPSIETTGTAGSGGTGSGAAGGVGVSCPAGTPTEAQLAGDCRVEVCDGEGSTTSVHDDQDAPEAAICTVTDCVDGQPVVTDAPDGETCGDDLSCLGGVCSGCRSAEECGTPEECNHFECTNPGPTGECTLLSDDPSAPCGPGPTCTSTTELTTYGCDGRGSCVAASQSCEPYACSGTSCSMDCTQSFGCAPGAVCGGTDPGFCQDCQTCNEWLNVIDTPPVCDTQIALAQALYDCTCQMGGPCLIVCNNSLCNNMSPQGADPCFNCLEQSCKTALDNCAGDVDPVP